MPSKLDTTAKLVSLWEQSATVLAFSSEADMTERQASNWAAYLRKRGVPLKKMTAPIVRQYDDDQLTEEDIERLRQLVQSEREGERRRRRVSYESAYKAGV